MIKNKKIMILSFVFMLMCSLIIFSGCTSKSDSQNVGNNDTREIVDMAGRKVVIPKKIEKIYTTSPVGQIAVYTLNPNKLAGWNYKLSPEEMKYIDEKYKKLPVLGGNFGKKNSFNAEEIIKIAPDIVIDMNIMNETTKTSADEMQKQLNIPVVCIDGSLLNYDQSYDLLGEVINEKEKAKELGNYCKKVTNEIQKKSKSIPEDQKVHVYYAEGPKGLQTDPAGSRHTEVLDVIGGKNVAEIAIKEGYGRGEVSFEQVALWKPDVILIYPEPSQEMSFYDTIGQDINWNKLTAVKNNKYYEVPFGPYNWFDRPPSSSRILGMMWLGNLLYPEIYNYDIAKETKVFYDKFYHYKLTDEEVQKLLYHSTYKNK
jgi:iron complex transport system substrate-binding protein